jgi:hypothetical protein
MVASDFDWQSGRGVDAYTYGTSTTFEKLEIWRVKSTNQGYHEAKKSRTWQPDEGTSSAAADSLKKAEGHGS